MALLMRLPDRATERVIGQVLAYATHMSTLACAMASDIPAFSIPAVLNKRLKRLLPTLPAGVAEIAWKAQERLHARTTTPRTPQKFARMTFHRKHAGTVASAVARELVGFIWAIGSMVESQHIAKTKAQAA
jgi:hypothetical protein